MPIKWENKVYLLWDAMRLIVELIVSMDDAIWSTLSDTLSTLADISSNWHVFMDDTNWSTLSDKSPS